MNKELRCWLKENSHLINFWGECDGYSSWLDKQPNGKYFNINLYGLGLIASDEEFRKLVARASHVGVDGIGASIIVWQTLGFWRKPFGYKFWGPRYLRLVNGERVLFIGGTKKESKLAYIEVFNIIDPSNKLYRIDGYSSYDNYKRIVLDYEPTICFVGTGMGQQESLVEELSMHWPNCKYFACGGWIKQLAGLEINCPRTISRIGLEWLWRSAFRGQHLQQRVLIPLRQIFK